MFLLIFTGLLACPGLRHFEKKNSAGGYESDTGGGWAAHVVPRERSCVIFFGLVALVLCGIRCPGGRAVEIRGGHFWRVRLPFQPDPWFGISSSCWNSRIGTQFGDEAPPGRSALALKMMYVWTQLVILNNMRYYKSRMCGFFSLRPFVGKQKDIKRTLPYISATALPAPGVTSSQPPFPKHQHRPPGPRTQEVTKTQEPRPRREGFIGHPPPFLKIPETPSKPFFHHFSVPPKINPRIPFGTESEPKVTSENIEN